MKRVPIQFLRQTAFIASLSSLAQLSTQASYQIEKGDSLSQIAESKYGDYSKWHALWDKNRSLISNPDLIFPGQRITLLDDKDIDLYASSEMVKRPARRYGGKSHEYELLPLQRWEKFVFQLDPEIDPDGFDRRSKVVNRIAVKTTAEMTIASDRIPVLGEILHARSEYDRLFLGEQIFIRADEQLQVGSIYSITTGPQKSTSPRDGRVGFLYDLTGKARIIGVRDGTFIATITAIYHPIQRGQLLIPEVQPYPLPAPAAAEAPLAATVLVPKSSSDDLLADQKIVFLDVGTEDGVKPGFIFRRYLHNDPATGEEITTKDFLIESELQVLSTVDKFSVAVILQSHSPIRGGNELVALTDLKDFGRNQGLQTVLQDAGKPQSVDELDQLDDTSGLGEKENSELRQLEKWGKPAPSTNPQSPDAIDEEIKKVDPQGETKKPPEMGHEAAPNDGTDKPETAPETPTAPVEGEPAPAPETAPAPDEAPPADAAPDANAPAPGDTIPPSPDAAPTDQGLDNIDLQGSAPPPNEPAPIEESKPAPDLSGPAEPTPSAPSTPKTPPKKGAGHTPEAAPTPDDPFASPSP